MPDRFVISNTFSLRMLYYCFHELTFEPVPEDCVREILQRVMQEDPARVVSIVGHESTAKLFSEVLGIDVPVNRVNYTFSCGDKLFVGVPNTPRLPEGKVLSKEELEKLGIQWWLVKFA
ncbi:STIV orfB116 family protein [Atrimonas thermophila]|uniref:STIV orfB116 family protein n=1 Tax=Atrimonas thermophila TaxID=3064161 RepID=UPI00399D4203